ncbi:probable cytochrome P450 12c1, mitochondrial [Eurosta solidaginis]|uniref:probable cytochrome P450 12c1, mitochondrial n=1 Tax=Eurosta solidaginis TaxID=178769 RepID=UPI003530D102
MLSLRYVRNLNACKDFKYIFALGQEQRQQHIQIAPQSTAANVKPPHFDSKSFGNALDAEWQQALPFKEIPSLSKFDMLFGFRKGGEFADLMLNEFFFKCRKRFGDIYRMSGFFGQPDSLILFNLVDYEKIFRTEGTWPIRPGLEALIHYRLGRKDGFFNETIGLAGDGESWEKFRHAVNPILMQPKNAKLYLEPMQKVNLEFIQRIRDIRDPQTLEVPENFFEDMNRLTFESVAVVAVNHEFGLIRKNPDLPEAKQLFDNINSFFDSLYELGIKPSLYKYIKTPTYRRFERSLDTIFDIIKSYVDQALVQLEKNPSKEGEERSVLEKLLKIDRKIATITAMDILTAGVDTTVSVLAAVFLCIAKNPDKQQKLREELLNVLPHKDDHFSIDNMKNLPYLRACIKEALRVYPITIGNVRTTGADLALSGYQVPKGTRVYMSSNMLLCEEKYFPHAKEFIPERWLRHHGDNEKLMADNLNKFIYLPFGFGPRSCIGKRIVDLELELSLGNLVRHFKVEYNHPADKPFKHNIISTPQIPLKFKFVDVNY